MNLDGLNPEQQAAVQFTGAPQLIVAGAGSGKTRVLTAKIAWLVSQGADPTRIVAVTFTNKAAREMGERLAALLPPGRVPRQVSTFHRLGLQMIRRHPEEMVRLGWRTFPVVADERELMTLARELFADRSEVGGAPKAAELKKRLADMHAVKRQLMYFDETLEGAAEQGLLVERFCSETAAIKAAESYELMSRAMQAQGLIDFDDMLLLPLQLLRRFPEVRQFEKSRIDWLLVDEYQDVDFSQAQLIDLLMEGNPNLTVVGDPDQLIYTWRGAEMEHILQFEHRFAGAKVHLLTRNYRSTGRILAVGNGLISHNFERPEKELWTEQHLGEPVTVVKVFDGQQEADFIASEILDLRDQGYRYRDIAVLYRLNANSAALERALLGLGVPYRVNKGQSFFARREVRDCLAWLRLATNPADKTAFERVVNLPARGLGPKARADFWAVMVEAGCEEVPAADFWPRLAQTAASLPARVRTGALQVADVLGRMADAGVDVDLLFSLILNDLGYDRVLADMEGDEYDLRFDNVIQLRDLIGSTADAAGSAHDLRSLLAQVALLTDLEMEGADGDDDVVLLSTLHGVKGLEFPVVCICGLENGTLPLGSFDDSYDELEEERRLFYVGITRAQERLYLTTASRRQSPYGRMKGKMRMFWDEQKGEYRFDSDEESSPSMFLRELPKEHLQEVNLKLSALYRRRR